MSKIKNKIAGNRARKQAARQVNAFKDLKVEMQKLMEAEDYVEAMDVMAEIAVNGKIDADVMYWGALCYFRTGDYERAAKWVNNALDYDSRGVKPRILLAAICIADGRYEDGMKVAELVLSGNVGNMDEADRGFMQEALEPVRYGYEDILAGYPKVVEMLRGEECADDNGAEESAASALAKLREMLGRKEQERKIDVPDTKENNLTEAVQNEIESDDGLAAEGENTQEAVDVVGTIQQVMDREASLQEKIRLLNAFAGGCYQSGDYQAAREFLSKALELDAFAPEILKNMAYVCLTDGNMEMAMEYAAKLPMVDFGLLYALKRG